MIIFSQDRKSVIDCKIVEVTRNLGGGKESKYVLTASASGFGVVTVGSYPEEKSAMDELEKIYAAFEAGAKIYKVN